MDLIVYTANTRLIDASTHIWVRGFFLHFIFIYIWQIGFFFFSRRILIQRVYCFYIQFKQATILCKRLKFQSICVHIYVHIAIYKFAIWRKCERVNHLYSFLHDDGYFFIIFICNNKRVYQFLFWFSSQFFLGFSPTSSVCVFFFHFSLNSVHSILFKKTAKIFYKTKAKISLSNML